MFSRINRAHSILFNPSSRVEHLYELLFQDSIRKDGPLSSNVMELFSEIGELTIFADGLIKKKDKTLTSLGEALIAKDMANLQTQLFEMNGKVRGAKSAILETFPVQIYVFTQRVETLIWATLMQMFQSYHHIFADGLCQKMRCCR